MSSFCSKSRSTFDPICFLLVVGVLLCDNFTKLLFVAGCMGAAKGIRTVYMILVIPNHVTINKLASASGIRMVANGLVLLFLGPVVGELRIYSFIHSDENEKFFRSFRLDTRFLRKLCYLHHFHELCYTDLYHFVDYRNTLF